MPSVYIEHPQQGYNNFLILIVRYGYFNRKYFLNDKLVIGIHQVNYAKFLGQSQSNIYKLISRAIKEGLFVCISKEHYFQKNQKGPSNLYSIDYSATRNYLFSQNIDPLEDYQEALEQVVEFGKSLVPEKKRIRREKADEIRQKKLLKDFCHGTVFNQAVRDFNDVLRDRNLGFFADQYLDECKFRATNIICSTVNPSNHTDDFFFDGDTKRKEFLREFGLKHPVEHDVNASIYRLTYNLNHPEQLPQNIDVYKLFWDALRIEKTFTKDVRNHLKKLCMPIYMKEQGIYSSYENFVKAEWNPLFLKDKTERDRFEALKFIEEYTNIELKQFLYSLADAMKRVLGVEKFYGRDIFLYESDLHAEMKLRLFDKGALVINCYDGFYGSRGEFTKELFYKAYEEATDMLKSVIKTRDKLQGKKEDFLYWEEDYEDSVYIY